MQKIYKKVMDFFNNRELILIIMVILVAVVFLIQLFNLQIVNGGSYRQQSQKRMLRTENVTAPRGEIYDRNGVVLATNKLSYNVDMYKVKKNANTEENAKIINKSLEKLINILDQNSDKIYSTFPVNDKLNGFDFSTTKAEEKWKEEMGFEKEMSFEQVVNEYITKYCLEEFSDNRDMQIKIIKIRYEASLRGYSLFNGVTIAKDISEKSVACIEEIKYELYGINVVTEPKRVYPNKYLATHVLGYVSKISSDEYTQKKEEGYSQNSIIGKAGIEESFEKYLKGVDGVKKVETDIEGNVSTEYETQKVTSGNSITLSLDYRLQKVAQESLESAIYRLRDGTLVGKKVEDADAGAVVVLDVNTGEVLAMASYPTYDNNEFVGGISQKIWSELLNNKVKPMYNRAISGTYSPGSTYKMLVGMAGLKTGKITLDEKILDTGIYPYGHKPKCWIYTQYNITHGYVNLSEAIKGSCNCYFYEVGRRIGIEKLVEYSKLFGLGTKTGIELDEEATGKIAGDGVDDNWYLGDTLSAAIGQSYNSYTPLQLANYIATIANGGKLNRVSLVKKINNHVENTEVSTEEIKKYIKEMTGIDFEEKDLKLDKEAVEAIKQGMLSVTNEQGGTANLVFKGSNITVAGKTGTSQVTSGSNNGIFVGFAPYDNPQIAVVAIIEHGGEGTYTANVVRPIMEEYFNITEQDKKNEKVQNVVENKIQF